MAAEVLQPVEWVGSSEADLKEFPAEVQDRVGFALYLAKGRTMKTDEMRIERSSGNVFTDLGRPDPEAQLLKAELVTRIDGIIRQRGLKQVEAANMLGLSQPDVSRLLRGDFREYSVERLLRLLIALGRDVEIVIREPPPQRQGRLSIGA